MQSRLRRRKFLGRLTRVAGFCKGYNECDCCTSLLWAADPTDPTLPPLCTPGVDPLVDPTTHTDADVPPSSGTTPAA